MLGGSEHLLRRYDWRCRGIDHLGLVKETVSEACRRPTEITTLPWKAKSMFTTDQSRSKMLGLALVEIGQGL